ncbi:MAG TPA: NAD(P)H-binding protein [Ktedonobacteraceae bacterium]
MARVLVTGGTGRLGREVVACLLAREHSARVLSHRAHAVVPRGVELFQGDMATGAGLREAVAGVDAIIHCASSPQSAQESDVEGPRLLLQAASASGSPHIVHISIVGVDQSDYPYYKAKLEAERLIEDEGLPWTILRTTQFHDFVLWLILSFGADTLAEVPVARGMRFQSIDVREVADRLVALMEQREQGEQKGVGRVPDMGGPEVRTIEEMAEAYSGVRGRKVTIRAEQMPGELYDVFRSGINLCPDHAEGKISWEVFLRQLYG